MITTASQLKERSLLGLKELSRNEIESILDRAHYWESQPEKLVPVLQSRFAANMFLKTALAPAFLLKWQRSGWALRF